MPKAAPDTTVCPCVGQRARRSRRPLPRRTSWPSASPTTATDRSTASARRSGPRTHRPSGAPPRPASGSARSRSSSRAGHSSSPGHTNRMPRSAARSQVAHGVEARRSRAATSEASPRSSVSLRSRSWTSGAPRSPTSPASRGSPGSPSRHSASPRHPVARRVRHWRGRQGEGAQLQRSAGTQPQGDVELGDPGRSTPRRSDDRPGQPVHPGRPALGQPAGVDLPVEPSAPRPR